MYKDCEKWLSSAKIGKDLGKLLWLRQVDNPMPLMFTSVSAYEDWVSSLDPEFAAAVDRNSVRLKGVDMPSSLLVETSQGSTLSLTVSGDGEYVVVPMSLTWCAICGWVLTTVVAWAFSRFVLDPTFDALTIWFRGMVADTKGHDLGNVWSEEETRCPYLPWCLGTWQRVVHDYDGQAVDCECECGAFWTVYNSMY